MVVNRVGQLFHSNNTIEMDHALGRLSLTVSELGGRDGLGGNERLAIDRLTRELSADRRGVVSTLGDAEIPLSLATRCSDRNGPRLSIPASSVRSRVSRQLSLRRTMGSLYRASQGVVRLQCCQDGARARATGVLSVARIRVDQQRGGVLATVQGGVSI